MRGIVGVVAAALFFGSAVAFAAPPKPEEIPAPLRDWQDWVLHNNEKARCPFFQGDTSSARCIWPTRAEITLTDKGGTFVQSWLTRATEWAPLPGDAKHWPQGVSVDGAAAVVIPQDGRPGVSLKSGSHTVRGTFAWDSLPESIAVPTETGLVALTVNGKSIDFPERDDAGRVWLSRKAAEGAAENRLDVVVHRKLTDDVPITLTTQVELHVSGKSREELLGRALPDGFVPMSLDAPMPARIEADGKLRVQVWPGTWTITLVARASSPDVALTMPKTDAAWGPEEVWTFEARPRLRLVQVEGVPSIDPQQTTIPDAWKRLPTFRVKPGETMKLVQTRRGDTEPAPDQLNLARTLWLDFDGGGFTVQDRITGALNRAWRLEMGPETSLGRVAIGGRDQFITRTSGGTAGVEVRQGQLDLTADSRVDGAARTLAAVGWSHDFASVSGTLHLPPGWRLFAASGADDVPQSWIRSWSLLDMFLVLILAVAIARLWGWKWGALSLAALTLTFPEDGAPQWIWAAVLVGEALYRVVPANWFKKVMTGYRFLVIAILLVMAVPFWVKQIRTAMYPALGSPESYRGEPWWVIGGAKAPMSEAVPMAVPEAPMGGEGNDGAAMDEEQRPQEQNIAVDGKLKEFKKGEATKSSPRQSFGLLSQSVDSGRYADVAQMNYYEHDPKAMVQTGPGLPRWTWSTVYLQWSGPVAATQKLTLYLVPPWLNFVLALIRVALTALLAWVMLDVPGDKWPKVLAALVPKSARAGAAAAALAVAALVVLAPRDARAASDVVPPPEVLKDLQQRLLEKPDCFPNCASSPRMELEADGGRLTLRMEIGAAAATAVPLPGSAQQWLPSRVAVDGQPANGLVRVGDLLWLELEPGAHQIVMDGPLPTRTTVQIRLPLKPHYVTAKASGWTLAGLHEDGIADDNLQLARLEEKGPKAAAATLSQGSLPPFVRVERTLNLGLNWQVITRVIRVTPAGSAVVIQVPLIPGESVTTNDVRVVDGKALVNMGATATEVEWLSVLAPATEIRLAAPKTADWTEVWRLDASPIWHADAKGIPPVHPANAAVRAPEWHPWPGEDVTLTVTRPEGVPGQTLTIDHSSLTLKPGKRATDATLAMTVRSSRGGQHVITLPAGAELQSVTIDSQSQPIRAEKDGKVSLPVVPGSQEISLDWRENDGIGMRYVAPAVDIGAPSVNADTTITMPTDRWVLFVRGPRLGPAVLFWSLIAVLLLISIGLGRVTLTPLKTWQWILLGLGLSQIPVVASAFVAGWLLALGWRKEKGKNANPFVFNAVQLGLVFWTLLALGLLCWAIEQGLLGEPDMQIVGNGSWRTQLQWYADRSGAVLPQPSAISVPLWVYRVAMLSWALWIAFALLGWLKWAWTSFGSGGFYKALPMPARKPASPAAAGAAPKAPDEKKP